MDDPEFIDLNVISASRFLESSSFIYLIITQNIEKSRSSSSAISSSKSIEIVSNSKNSYLFCFFPTILKKVFADEKVYEHHPLRNLPYS